MPPCGLSEFAGENFMGISVFFEGSILKLWTKWEIAARTSVIANLIPMQFLKLKYWKLENDHLFRNLII